MRSASLRNCLFDIKCEKRRWCWRGKEGGGGRREAGGGRREAGGGKRDFLCGENWKKLRNIFQRCVIFTSRLTSTKKRESRALGKAGQPGTKWYRKFLGWGVLKQVSHPNPVIVNIKCAFNKITIKIIMRESILCSRMESPDNRDYCM